MPDMTNHGVVKEYVLREAARHLASMGKPTHRRLVAYWRPMMRRSLGILEGAEWSAAITEADRLAELARQGEIADLARHIQDELGRL